MRAAAQVLTKARGVQRCGRVPVIFGGDGSVTLRRHAASGRGYFGGLERCSNPWQCPVCVVRVQGERCRELRQFDHAHRAAGGGAAMATLTVPHGAGDSLRGQRKDFARAWQRCIAGAPWGRQRAALGVVGYLRAMEVTYGWNGWHCHLHVVLYTHRPLERARLEAFEAWLLARWTRYVTRAGYRAPTAEHGVRVEGCRDASYIAKMGLAAELSLGSTKAARPGHRTPMQILRDLTMATDPADRAGDVALWREWCQAMHGARQLTWSRGLAKVAAWYGCPFTRDDAALPDPQIELPGMPAVVEREPTAADALVYEFSGEEWRAIVTHRRSVQLRLELLAIPESRPPDQWGAAVVRLLDKALGLEPVPF